MITFKGIEIDRAGRAISHRGVTHEFSRTRNASRFKMALFFLLAGGASKEMAFWHLYGNDPDGGPESGELCIATMLTQLQICHLRELQLEIRSWKIAGVTFYEIVPVFELPALKRFSHTGKNNAVKMAGAPINSRVPA